jgi:hypothetical protein
MNKPDLPQYEAEVNRLAALPPVTIKIPPVEALALITLVQAGMLSDRGIAQHGFTQIAVAGARKLQRLFSEDSETYKALEYGWHQTTSLPLFSVDDVVPPTENTNF